MRFKSASAVKPRKSNSLQRCQLSEDEGRKWRKPCAIWISICVQHSAAGWANWKEKKRVIGYSPELHCCVLLSSTCCWQVSDRFVCRKISSDFGSVCGKLFLFLFFPFITSANIYSGILKAFALLKLVTLARRWWRLGEKASSPVMPSNVEK